MSTGTYLSTVLSTPLAYHSIALPMGGGRSHPPCHTYIYPVIYTHQVLILVTTNSCQLRQSNGSLICPFVGDVTAGVHNEGWMYLFSFAEWQSWQEWQGNWKVAHESDWQRFMETLSLLSFLSWIRCVDSAVICPPTMRHRHALYDSRRVTDGR